MSLSDVQRRVAAIILSVPEATGFALAGGAALIAHGVIDRDTRDLDCFGASAVDVDRLVPAAIAALGAAGFAVESEEQQIGFARLRVTWTSVRHSSTWGSIRRVWNRPSPISVRCERSLIWQATSCSLCSPEPRLVISSMSPRS